MKHLRILAMVLSFGMSLGFVAKAFAQNEESEEARLASEKAKRRHYAGGKDEQELTVQAVLPNPTRYPADPKSQADVKPAAPIDEGHD